MSIFRLSKVFDCNLFFTIYFLTVTNYLQKLFATKEYFRRFKRTLPLLSEQKNNDNNMAVIS